MSDWVAYCSADYRELVRRAVGLLDPEGSLTVARSADALRRVSLASEPGEVGIVVGPVDEGVSDVNLAAAIADDGNVRCVVLACESATGSLRSRAARAGIDRVMDLSEMGAEKHDRAAAPEIAQPVQREGSDAPVLVFCSGRGGVGKTTVASSSAVIAARWGLRTCLIDFDLSCGNAYSGFGLPRGSDLAVLSGGATGPEALARSVLSAAPRVSLMGPCDRPEMAEAVAPHAGGVLEWAEREFDLVVVDASTTFTDSVAQAVQRADRLVLVSDGRAGSVSSLARMSGLAVRLGVARARIARLQNRADPRARAEVAEARSEVGLEAARVYRVVDGGGEVEELLSSGRVRELCEPGYPYADSVASMLAQLLAELGRLPDLEEARRAYEAPRARRKWGLLGPRREARD